MHKVSTHMHIICMHEYTHHTHTPRYAPKKNNESVNPSHISNFPLGGANKAVKKKPKTRKVNLSATSHYKINGKEFKRQ